MDINQIAQQIQNAIQTKNWQLVAMTGLVAVVYLIRKYASKIHGRGGDFLNSDRGGSLLVLASGVAMSWMTAVKTGMHLSASVVLSGLVTAALSSGARNIAWDLLRPADEAPAKPVAVPPAAALVFLCLFVSCATPGAQAIKNCEINLLPQTEQAAMACVVSASTSSGDAQAAITACASGIVPSQFNCLIQGVETWWKSTMPAKGEPRPDAVRAITNLEIWQNAHGKTSCNQNDVNQLSKAIWAHVGYASVNS